MTRRIVMLDVTAMAGSAVCMAGIDLKSGAHVRLSNPQPTTAFARLGPGIHPGDVIEIDYAFERKREAPHVEDAAWKPRSLKRRPAMPIDDVRRIAGEASLDSVVAAFGAPVVRASNANHGWALGAGARSLATVRVRSVQVDRDPAGRLRLTLTDTAGDVWEGVPFQDLSVRSHERNCTACVAGHIAAVREEFAAEDALVRVGLTRAFSHEGGDPLCWLQVTNVIVLRTHF